VLKLMGKPYKPAVTVTTAQDRYKFALYRPPFDREDLIAEWSGDFIHDL
jgi:hypothetical protein